MKLQNQSPSKKSSEMSSFNGTEIWEGLGQIEK